MYANALLGVWPYIFQDNPCLRKLYNVYSRFTFYYFILFIISAIMELFILVADDENRTEEIVANLCITLIYIITAVRVYVMRSTTIRNLIKQILATEDAILKNDDEEIMEIYKFHARQSQITNLIFIVNITVETIFFFTHPLYVDEKIKFNKATNETKVIKALPLSSWFPYDPQDHYLASYMWHIFDGTVGASYVMYTDAYNFSLIIFPLGQIRILTHVLSNFPRYVLKVKDQLQCSRDEASFITLRECILKHKEIMRYLQEYNDSMKNIMLLDFLQSSLQLASVVIQLFVVCITYTAC
ncbi:uncharacterized protein LOC111692342 [Anoplophora glabripennis]|uniref:uncharacterized protein LOC111692342 n=1 Tax=Anoplophora glabripennis TaxID=217634 RepID=UPI000C75FA84|nr:uncharacterized protein LOC111692342 [Anoplophora glabripennis]